MKIFLSSGLSAELSLGVFASFLSNTCMRDLPVYVLLLLPSLGLALQSHLIRDLQCTKPFASCGSSPSRSLALILPPDSLFAWIALYVLSRNFSCKDLLLMFRTM